MILVLFPVSRDEAAAQHTRRWAQTVLINPSKEKIPRLDSLYLA